MYSLYVSIRLFNLHSQASVSRMANIMTVRMIPDRIAQRFCRFSNCGIQRMFTKGRVAPPDVKGLVKKPFGYGYSQPTWENKLITKK